MERVRVGIVGLGSIAEALHIPGYLKHPAAEIVAVVDPDPGNRERVQRLLAERSGCEVRAFSDLAGMLSQGGVDAVSIGTPNATHVDLAVEAIEGRCHVLLEKPMAVTLEGAERLRAAAGKSDRVVMIGQSHRYRDDVAALRRFVTAGALGRIYHAEARILRRRGYPTGWFTDQTWAGGGPLMDIGVHALDLAWWMMGCPEPSRASGHLVRAIGRDRIDFVERWTSKMPYNQDNAVYTTEDFATALIRFGTGATLQLTVSWSMNGPEDDSLLVNLYGDRGGITLDPPAVYGSAEGVLTNTALPVTMGDLYQNEIDHFIECVRAHREPQSPVQDGYTVARMLVAIMESSERGEEVVVR